MTQAIFRSTHGKYSYVSKSGLTGRPPQGKENLPYLIVLIRRGWLNVFL